eukprot:6546336-Lingulodinium_polyedra.AAC.1
MRASRYKMLMLLMLLTASPRAPHQHDNGRLAQTRTTSPTGLSVCRAGGPASGCCRGRSVLDDALNHRQEVVHHRNWVAMVLQHPRHCN